MNFYIAEPVTRLPLFNFLVRYIFTEVLFINVISIKDILAYWLIIKIHECFNVLVLVFPINKNIVGIIEIALSDKRISRNQFSIKEDRFHYT